MSITALARLVDQGVIDRGISAREVVWRASENAARSGAGQLLPLRAELDQLLPWSGLRRGATVAVASGAPGATSLLLMLIAEPVRAGSWCAVVGVPALGAAAAAELGIDLERFALVPDPGPEWATVVAALLDGLDIVVARPPGPVTGAVARRLAARARQRGSVLVPYGEWDGADVVLRATGQAWHGLGTGRGRLSSRELSAVSSGRGAAAHRRSVLLRLPSDDSPQSGSPGATTRPVAPTVAASTLKAPALTLVNADGPAMDEAS